VKNLLKSLFISAFISVSAASLAWAALSVLHDGLSSPWLGTALATCVPNLFFLNLLRRRTPRTSRNLLPMTLAGALGTAVSTLLAGTVLHPAVAVSALVGLVAVNFYVYGYSRFAARVDSPLRKGAALPSFSLWDNGVQVSSSVLAAQPALWIFYRGNWCPLCMAQIREVAAQYRELSRRGVHVYMVSPQPEANSAALSRRFDAPMRFLTDRNNEAARALGICEDHGLPMGLQALGYDSDVPRPTVLITERDGTLIYCDMTDNYRVRPEPADFLAVLDAHAGAASP
jgi:peroxiredoxin